VNPRREVSGSHGVTVMTDEHSRADADSGAAGGAAGDPRRPVATGGNAARRTRRCGRYASRA
jgi:hypothetical protein